MLNNINSEIVSILHTFPFIFIEISIMKYLYNHIITEVILLGLLQYTPIHFFLFDLITIRFLFTLTGNNLWILLILVDPHLHIPMYFFLCQLFLIVIFFTVAFVLKMMNEYLLHKTVMTHYSLWHSYLPGVSFGWVWVCPLGTHVLWLICFNLWTFTLSTHHEQALL